ncbi:hypothetical protein GW17_00021064 [Ensete ventricosum]|nr:hypothetical protein GW17_00021064 [Ensete ventricosum]
MLHIVSLKPELFEGLRFDFTKGLNQRFSLSHSVFMGSMEVPSQASDTLKVPTAHYEFGANFLDPKLMLVGRVLTDGRLNARVKCDLTDNLTLKINAQLTNEPHFSQGMFNFDYKVSLPKISYSGAFSNLMKSSCCYTDVMFKAHYLLIVH